MKIFPVAVSMEVINLLELNQLDSTITIQTLFSQFWFDDRLIKNCRHDDIHLTPEDRKKLWTPNLSISNALDATLTKAPTPEARTTVNDEGIVALMDVLVVKVSCKQDFVKFPFDTMTCQAIVTPSYGNNIKEIYVHWEYASVVPGMMTLATHELLGFHKDRINISDTKVDIGIMTLKRYSTFYIFQAYIPNALTVMIAWLSFSISPSAVPARVTMGISSLIAMVLQYGNLIKSIPKVGYLKGIDIWMFGCVMFIVGSMGEFAYICHLQSVSMGSAEKRIRKIDMRARIAYPVAFVVFLVLYFGWTLIL